MRPGDDLGIDTFQEFAISTGQHQEAAILYSDERRYDYASNTTMDHFKPDWSPELFLSTNYLGKLCFIRSDLLMMLDVSLADLQHNGAYDFLLRLTDSTPVVYHIQKLLYHSTQEPDTIRMEKTALARAMQRHGITAKVMQGCVAHHYRVQRRVETHGMVSIIIPTIAAKGLIKGAITSIRQRSTYRNFEIVCIDGIPASDREPKQWLQQNSDKIVKAPKRFNWSRCNNIGAAAASGEFLLFMNDDMEVIDPDWLQALLEHAQQPEIGVVGPLLLFPEGKVQHAGLTLTQNGGRHLFRYAEATEPGPFGMIQTQRNVIGVTGACMMTSRDNFEKIGRFDESHSVINNDVDFCLRSWEKGFRVVYTPHTRLIHYEETSRSSLKNAYNSLRFDNIWKTRFALGDPFANPSIAAEIEHENAEYRPEAEPTRAICVGHPLISLPDVKRILAVKLDHIGDFILALPAFERLRERFPTAEITALVGKSSASLARATPSIDRVIEFAFFHTRSGKGRVRLTQKLLADLQRRLASFRFDIAIDLRQHMDTRYILRAAGATWLAGYDVRGEAGWLDVILELVNDIERQEKRAHLSDSLIHLVEAVATACNPTRSVFRGASQAEARQVVASLPSLASLTDKMFSAPLVCIHPGVGVATRQWPPEYLRR